MDVLVVLHTPRASHSSVYLGYAELAAFAASRGHSVRILTPQEFPPLARLHGRWVPVIYPALVDRWLRRRAAEFDVVIFHSYAGWRVSRWRHRPFRMVTAFHGLEPLFYRELVTETARRGRPLRLPFRVLHGRLVPAFARASCRRSDRVVCLNRVEARYLTDQGWVGPDRLAILTHGVAPLFFIDRCFPRQASTLAFVGQWLPWKGVDTLGAAFTALARQRSDLRLWCAGTLAEPAAVRADFPPDVRTRVDVYPRVTHEELARLYGAADVFILPSCFEGCARALLEAMAASLPIVTTPVGAAPDLLVPEVHAVFVPARDADALAQSVAALLDDPVRRERLGRAARQVADGLRLDTVNGRWLDMLDEVARRGDGNEVGRRRPL